MTLDPQSVYGHAADIVEREIDGELIIVPVAAGIGDLDEDLYTLSGTGRRIWELLDGQQSLQAIAEALLDDYNAEPDTLRDDVISFCQELARRKLISVSDQPDRGTDHA